MDELTKVMNNKRFGALLSAILVLSGCAPTSAYVSSIGARSLNGRAAILPDTQSLEVPLKDSARTMAFGHSGAFPYMLNTDSEGSAAGSVTIDRDGFQGLGFAQREVSLTYNGTPTTFDVRTYSYSGKSELLLEHNYRQWYGYPAQGLLLLSIPLDAAIDVVALGGMIVAAPFVYGISAIKGSKSNAQSHPQSTAGDGASTPDTSPADGHSSSVDVYIIPVEPYSFEAAEGLAHKLSTELKLNVKASLPMGPKELVPLAGGSQFAADDIIQNASNVASRLPNKSDRAITIALTTLDINDRAQPLRFLFSRNNKVSRTSVISVARMSFSTPIATASPEQTSLRLYKMTKRTIGEQFYGLSRSSNIADIMYAPIMSLEDIDAMGIDFKQALREVP
jgi:predicted Zn-dependent protease